VSVELIKQLSSKVRNIFSVGTFRKRHDDGKLEVKTLSDKILKKNEAFPYGFAAKAKSGKVFIFCPGGNFDGFEIMPLIADDAIKPPELTEGDAALYTASGGWLICRENGTVELFGTDLGGIVKAGELKNNLEKLSARVDGIIDALKNSPTAVQDGGAAYKAGIVTALVLLADKENFSNLESEKVFHGTGQ